MSEGATGEKLCDQRYVTLILRLRVDGQGRIVGGEVTDLWLRTRRGFAGRGTLLDAVESCIDELPPPFMQHAKSGPDPPDA